MCFSWPCEKTLHAFCPLYFLCIAALFRGLIFYRPEKVVYMAAHICSDEASGEKNLFAFTHPLWQKSFDNVEKTPFSFFPVVFMGRRLSIVSQYAFARCLDAKHSTPDNPELVGKLWVKSLEVGKQLWCIALLLSVFLRCSAPYSVFNPEV